jgi:hypothetical protein
VVKATKNFVCFAIVGVLRMLYENCCDHVEELQIIMEFDASILEDLSEELVKLNGLLVKKCWTEYGLPNVADRFRKKPEVRLFSVHCVVLEVESIFTGVFLCCRCR